MMTPLSGGPAAPGAEQRRRNRCDTGGPGIVAHPVLKLVMPAIVVVGALELGRRCASTVDVGPTFSWP